MFYIPNSKTCAEMFEEGPDAAKPKQVCPFCDPEAELTGEDIEMSVCEKHGGGGDNIDEAEYKLEER